MAKKASIQKLKAQASTGSRTKKASLSRFNRKASTGTTNQKASLHRLKPKRSSKKRPVASKPSGLFGKPY